MHSRQRLLEDGAGDHALNLGFGDRHALSLHADMCGLGNAAWLLKAEDFRFNPCGSRKTRRQQPPEAVKPLKPKVAMALGVDRRISACFLDWKEMSFTGVSGWNLTKVGFTGTFRASHGSEPFQARRFGKARLLGFRNWGYNTTTSLLRVCVSF